MKARTRTHLVLMHALKPDDGTENRRDVSCEARAEIFYRFVPLPVGVHGCDVGEWAGKKPVIRRNVHLAHNHVHERVVHRAVAVDGGHEIRRADNHPSAGDFLRGAIDRQLRLHGAVGHVVEPAVIVRKMAYRLASQARIKVALAHSSDDDQMSLGFRPKFAEGPDFQFCFAAWLVLLQIAIDCKMRYRYDIAAVDALRAGVKFKRFFPLGACFQLVVTDLQSRVLGRSVTRKQRIILGARLTVEGAEIRLAVGKMYGPGDACGALGVTGCDFTDGTKLSVISLFVFENAKPRRLGLDLPVGRLELSLRAGLRIDV